MSLLSLAFPPQSASSAYLDVNCSVRGLKWTERLPYSRAHLASAISQRHNLPEILGRLLAARDVMLEDVPDILNPTIRALLPDPNRLQDMQAAVDRIARAIAREEQIAIFGDYDVDGAASSALLYRFLKWHGIEARIYIPDRLAEGYGPNETAFQSLTEAGASLIITVDCGSTSHAPIEAVSALGADVVVIDHHQCSEILPPARAVVNPNRQDCLSGQGHLCAAGVVFMLCVGLLRALRLRGTYAQIEEPPLLRWLDLVALATVCDVVPLQGVNRAFVVQGLKILRSRENEGLKALCDAAGVKKPATPYTLGFILGPRINAGGRIGDAALGAKLLVTTDPAEAAHIASILDRLNKERREMELRAVEEAMAVADKLLLEDGKRPILIAGSPGWHKGLIGLVASRITERCQTPSLIFSEDPDTGDATGSGRSIAGVDIGLAVRNAVALGLAKKGGGHAMAAGVTVAKEQRRAFEAYLYETLRTSFRIASAEPCLMIDGAVTPRALTVDFACQIEQAGPYGQGNPSPRFCVASVRPQSLKEIGGGHIKCTLQSLDGSQMTAVAFRSAQSAVGQALVKARDFGCHVAGRIERDEWAGRDRVEFQIEDLALLKQ